MTCIGCGAQDFTHTHQQETDQLEGMRFIALLPGQKCTACGWVYLDPSALEQYELLIADRLGASGAQRGKSLKFMRRAARLPLAELAHRLGVYAETIRAWEEDECPVTRQAFEEVWSVVRARLDARAADFGFRDIPATDL